jgi:hypothetical protein
MPIYEVWVFERESSLKDRDSRIDNILEELFGWTLLEMLVTMR